MWKEIGDFWIGSRALNFWTLMYWIRVSALFALMARGFIGLGGLMLISLRMTRNAEIKKQGVCRRFGSVRFGTKDRDAHGVSPQK
ncbi:hypothetical protein CYPRO_0166 [Cyclonatronum proteinivorum]|uniref:Uncharacterized protein n=1 Tax=Cyclonatronum proteinivorum TaxID=1457365 RepID=A0A345UG52_9BACT|nr:hypothetical protein CYPRO_0166 [Cyclonatronum proteinivorum]